MDAFVRGDTGKRMKAHEPRGEQVVQRVLPPASIDQFPEIPRPRDALIRRAEVQRPGAHVVARQVHHSPLGVFDRQAPVADQRTEAGDSPSLEGREGEIGIGHPR